MPLLEARQYVRICAVPGSQDIFRKWIPIQIGLPGFLQSGSSDHFELIKEWIRACDGGRCSHRNLGSCYPNFYKVEMPTRVIDVRDGITVSLIQTDKMSQGKHYVALSHCWGKLLGEKNKERDKWNTTSGEVEQRMRGFAVKDLPQTFQDAIKVTRVLGQQYLWIDSLCIIQGKDGDWDTEAKKMETVFRNAYFTIAATSAEDSTKGFLNRPPEDYQFVILPNSSHGEVCVSTLVDDFPGDVEEGYLNKRAWVLQERALSRRIIHFTKKQTYWECGGGVHCETLTYMFNQYSSFRRDPKFPRSIRYRSRRAQIKLFQSLFTDYSKLDLTFETDRPIAIDSLAVALAEVLYTKVTYGILDCFLHRSLSWQRSQNDYLRPISYTNEKSYPPTWSWMAYYGPIQYLDIEGFVEWDRSVQVVEVKANDEAGGPAKYSHVLEARVKQYQDCTIGPNGLIRDLNNEVGFLHFDAHPQKVSAVQCAILGRECDESWDESGDESRKYYILFVTECALHAGCGNFERVGMGWIQERFINFDDQDDVAQIH